MRFALLTALVGLAASAFAQSSTADAYVASESPIAKAGLLANIGPSGSKSSGAKVSSSLRDVARAPTPVRRVGVERSTHT